MADHATHPLDAVRKEGILQDRYAGDVGDFVKLALLRALLPSHKLGVAWYHFPDEEHNKDGRHIGYLGQRDMYAHLDLELFDHLDGAVKQARTISSLLPALPGAIHSSEFLDVSAVPNARRRQFRMTWFARTLAEVERCDLVFADPDNGIVDDQDWRKGSATFGKQMPLSEVKALARGRCAVVYHHNTRRAGGHDKEVDYWLEQIGLPALAVRATAFSPRTFFVLNPSDVIADRVYRFCTKWQPLRVRLHARKS